jgi:hypothetical protein
MQWRRWRRVAQQTKPIYGSEQSVKQPTGVDKVMIGGVSAPTPT